MRKSLFLAVAIFTFSCFAFAQSADSSFEYGKPSDLKGLTKIYVETMGDLKENERIVERLSKAKVPNMEIVEDIEDAQIVPMFGGDNFSGLVGATHNTIGNTTNSTLMRVNLLAGEGRVFVSGSDGKKARLVMRVQNEQESKWEKRPITKFVNDFVKVYKKANGIN